MDTKTAQRPASKPAQSALVTEGKTKKIYRRDDGSDLVTVISKDDITAGDGAKHDVIPEKSRLANLTTCNVFRLLKSCGIPVAFEEQDSPTSFIAPNCAMLPYEVVVRREAHGSYLKRHPHLSKGLLFPQLIVEFYLKTKDKDWKGKPLVSDDPLMLYKEGAARDSALQPGEAAAGPGAVPDAADLGRIQPRRGMEDFPRDAQDRAPRLPGAREGLATGRRHAGRSQGRVRSRRQAAPPARRRDRQ